MQDLLSFIVAGFALAGSPGPNTLSLAATGAAFGARRGLRYLVGIGIGMVGVMAIAGTGVMGVVLAIPGAAPVIVGLAAAYFLYLAYRIATAPPLAETQSERRPPAFAAGVFQSLVNPKAYAAMAALFSGFVLVTDSLEIDMTAKLAVLTAIITTVNLAWLLAGAALTRLFRDPATNRAINLTFAVLLLASVALALLV
ncbi:MAG: LysE family translocator [Rhodospirillaceae bacterium]|nr:LysE family translocator [Rhodospirillaceae bacterium]